MARRARFCGTRCLCPNRFRSKLMQHIFTGGFPDSCYEIQLRFMVFFILNMICYANAACDSLIKSICYHEAKRGRWDFRIMGRVREACGFVIRHHFAHCHTARGSVCAASRLAALIPSPTPCRHSDRPPKWLHNSRVLSGVGCAPGPHLS